MQPFSILSICRLLLITLIFLSFNSIFGQELALDEQVQILRNKIENSYSEERLKLMDSLVWLLEFNSKYKYDSITKATIDYAYQLDSTHLAMRHTSSLIFYYANRANNPKEGVKIFNEFKSRAIKSNDYNLLGRLYTNAADSYYFSGKTEESISIYDKAEEFSLKAKDSTSYILAKSYKSGAYQITGDYVTASKLLLETSEYFQSVRDTSNLLWVRNQLATLYSKIGFNKEAKKERDEIIDISRHQHNHNSLVPNLYNAALEEGFKGDQVARINYLLEAYSHVIEPEYNLSLEPVITYGLLNAYAVTDSLFKASTFFNKIQNTYAKQSPIPYESNYRTALADYYIATKDYNKALKEGQWVLNHLKSTRNIWGVYHMDERLSKIYKALGNTQKSYNHYVDFVTLRDSINSVKKANGLSYYQTLYETEKKDAEIAIKASSIKLLEEQNKAKQYWMLFGGIGALFMLLFLFIRYRQQIKYKALENQLLNADIEYKRKDLKHLALDITYNREWALILADKLQIVKSSRGKKRANELDALETEIKNKIWVDESTEDFHNKIEVISSSFYDKLNKEFPDLTKSEKRLCSLIKMRMDTKQIAILQNINPSSVKMSRNRLRKKLNLTSNDDLNTFLETY